MYVYIYVYVYIYMYTWIYMYAYIYIYSRIYTYIYVYIYVPIGIYIYNYKCIYVYMQHINNYKHMHSSIPCEFVHAELRNVECRCYQLRSENPACHLYSIPHALNLEIL